MVDILKMRANRRPQNPSPDYLTDEVSTEILEILKRDSNLMWTTVWLQKKSPKFAQYSYEEMETFMEKLFDNDDVIRICDARHTYWKFKEK